MENSISDAQAAVLKDLTHGKKLPTEVSHQAKVKAVGVAYTATLDDSGATLEALTDNTVITLPLTTTCKGMRLRVRAVCADDAALISLSPQSVDKIKGSVVGITGAGNATVVSSAAALNKDWNMTKSGINNGDYVEVESDGVDSWFIIGGIGIQASEA